MGRTETPMITSLWTVLFLSALAAAGEAAPTDARPAPQSGLVEEPFRVAEVPVRCVLADSDSGEGAVLCRPVSAGAGVAAEGRGARLFGRLGFLAGLHLGGAISSTGSLSASHSLNVFGKVMNTALSVSYGPNGYYQGPLAGRPPGGAPLGPVGPGFGLGDDPNSGTSSSTATPSSNKGDEAASLLSRKRTPKPSVTRIVVETPKTAGDASEPQHQLDNREENRLPNAEVIGNRAGDAAISLVHEVSSLTPQRVKVVVEDPTGGVVTVENKPNDAGGQFPSGHEGHEGPGGPKGGNDRNDVTDDEVIGEEPEPPPPQDEQPGLKFSAERKAQLQALARVRVSPPSPADQRRVFLEQHNKHVATFNQHLAKYNGDVSKVALISRS